MHVICCGPSGWRSRSLLRGGLFPCLARAPSPKSELLIMRPQRLHFAAIYYTLHTGACNYAVIYYTCACSGGECVVNNSIIACRGGESVVNNSKVACRGSQSVINNSKGTGLCCYLAAAPAGGVAGTLLCLRSQLAQLRPPVPPTPHPQAHVVPTSSFPKVGTKGFE